MHSKRSAALRSARYLAATTLCLGLFAGSVLHSAAQEGAPKDDHSRAMPIPKDPHVVVLFAGKESELSDNWVRQGSDQAPTWEIKDGAMTTKQSSIVTKQKFKDFQLHVEFKVPYMPEAHGQERGNSGIGLLGIYEIQVLDSYGIKEPGSGDCGSVYSQSAPLVNACKPPLQWQTYDISFHSAVFDADGKVAQKAHVTVFQNGICVQNSQEINGGTGIGGRKDVPEGPIILQFHNNTVQFRNVWIVPLAPEGAKHYEPR